MKQKAHSVLERLKYRKTNSPRYIDAGFDQAGPELYGKRDAHSQEQRVSNLALISTNLLRSIKSGHDLFLSWQENYSKAKVRSQKVNVLLRPEPMPTRKEQRQKL